MNELTLLHWFYLSICIACWSYIYTVVVDTILPTVFSVMITFLISIGILKKADGNNE